MRAAAEQVSRAQHQLQLVDIKIFTVASPINAQNIVSSSTKKRDAGAKHQLRTRLTFCRSVMLSAAVSQLGCTELFCVEPGSKGNGGAYYQDVLLMQKLLPAIRNMSGDFIVFQQDNASAHRVRDIVALPHRETAELIGPKLWSAKSPDFNPVDYNLFGLIQERVYQTEIRNIDDLKQRLISV